MSSHEVMTAFEYIYTTLSGDATLTSLAPGGVWRTLAPDGTASPFTTMAFQSGIDTMIVNAARIFSQPLLMIKTTGLASNTAAVEQAAARVDVLLQRTSGQTSDSLILVCYRESPWQQDELVNADLWVSIGGLYRLYVQDVT